ncbi:MAG: hypothetical protein GKR93_17155 [Gammaproteobacteria bacterium]|nr:hypothetical protein [Gammaproteobacteria bacterium]
MAADVDSIPMRKSSAGMQLETRPLHIEEWLDKLPYIDFQKTGRILYQTIQATNKESIKPATRLELVELYNRPYQYYLDSQIKTGAQHTLQSISSMQAQLAILKKISVSLGLSCKLAVDELLKKKTLWGQSKPPLPAMLMSLNYLSHAMIFSFLEYAPIPKNVWREVNYIFTFAQDIGQENNTIVLPGKDANTATTSISHAYKKIVLASLADPHHLPFGAIWEIFEQLDGWAEFANLKKFEKPSAPSGYFVVNLDKDTPPLPYSKFNTKLATDKHRLIDSTALGKVIQQQLAAINNGQSLDSSIKISPYFAKSILAHMSKAWGLPPKRHFSRESREGSMKVTCGLNATYYFVNGQMDFIPPENDTGEHEYLVDPMEETIQRVYSADEWSLVDQGPGGFAVVKNDKPRDTVRVGDLVGVAAPTSSATDKWELGVIRWLMIRQNKIYKIGIQMIRKKVYPVALRVKNGSELEQQYRRAFLLDDPSDKSNRSIVCSKGLFTDQREFEIQYKEQKQSLFAQALQESTISFEHFNVSSKPTL